MKKELTQQQEQLKEQVKNEVEEYSDYYGNCLHVHFSFPSEEKFHIDIIEDYCSHMHIRGTFENDCMEITSISSRITQSATQDFLRYFADLMSDF